MEKTISITYTTYDDISELSEQDRELLLLAKNNLPTAYAPYSQFQVTCTALLENGKHVIGSNMENASYPNCICAEQNTLSTISSNFSDQKVLAMAITFRAKDNDISYPLAPCGMCRQVMLEYEMRQDHPIEVLLQGTSGPIIKLKCSRDLMPLSGMLSELLQKS